MLERRRRRPDRDPPVFTRLDLLDRDHRIEAVGQRIARVDDDRIDTEHEFRGRGLQRAGRPRGDDGDSVHRARMIVRRRQARDHRHRGDAVEAIVERDGFGRVIAHARPRQGSVEVRLSLLQRYVVQEHGAFAHGTAKSGGSTSPLRMRSSNDALNSRYIARSVVPSALSYQAEWTLPCHATR